MKNRIGVWSALLVAALVAGPAAAAAKNFIAVDYLGDGEREVRIHFDRVHAKQTAMEVVTDHVTRGLHLWQVTDGRHFIQAIFTAQGELKDCEYIRRKDVIGSFLSTFSEDAERAQLVAAGLAEPAADQHSEQEQMRNATFELLTELPDQYAGFLDYKAMKRSCKEHHRLIRKVVHNRKHGSASEKADAEAYIHRARRDLSLIFPGTKWCGDGTEARSFAHMGGLHFLDRCCRSHDFCPHVIFGLSEKYGIFNYRFYTMSHCRCDHRHRRDLLDVFRLPGTKWCGKGYTATSYSTLGGYAGADRCCRHHDKKCPYWISSLEEKYGLFNWGISTLNHCACDERFHTCLKMTGSGAANMVGKIFFNVIKTKCFVLKKEEECIKSSWWGNECEEKRIVKRAALKDPLAY